MESVLGPLVFGNVSYSIGALESRIGGSTFWILPRVWEVVGSWGWSSQILQGAGASMLSSGLYFTAHEQTVATLERMGALLWALVTQGPALMFSSSG